MKGYDTVAKRWAACAVLLLAGAAVCHAAKFRWRGKVSRHDTAIHIAGATHDSIMVHYTGCSGFFIGKGSDMLLFDPFFSYETVLHTRLMSGRKHIPASLINNIDNVFTRALGVKKDTGAIDALIIDHAHVDHLGDVPWLLQNHYLPGTVKIIGNTTAGHYIRAHDPAATHIVPGVEDSAASWLAGGRWVAVNRHIRVMPIVSEHGPHVKVLGAGISFASGRHEMRDRKRGFPLCYGTGQTLAYMVDFLNDDGSISFRIYHSSASANAPLGFPPAAVLAEHGIDLAILCAASFNQVHGYPDKILRYLRPRHTIFSHWEDFMLSSYEEVKEEITPNFAYNYNKLFRRVNHTLHDLYGNDYLLRYTIPNVDTRMMVYY